MLKNQNAFTLIELLVALTVLGVMIGLAIPGFNNMLINHRSVTLGEDFASSINFVRSEAVKRGARVSLCASTAGVTCNGSWVDGYMAFVDLATTDKATAPVVGTILKVWEKPNSQAEISVLSGAASLTFLRFTALGTLAKVKSDPLIIKVNLKKCTGDAARRIDVGSSGMVSSDRAGC